VLVYVSDSIYVRRLHGRRTTRAGKKDLSFFPGNSFGSVHIGSILSNKGVGEAFARKRRTIKCQTKDGGSMGYLLAIECVSKANGRNLGFAFTARFILHVDSQC
jgi:hypothetical protein